MRTIRRLLMLAVLGVGGIAAFNYWSANGGRVPRPEVVEAANAKQYATQLANRAATKAGNVANRVGDTMDAGALTAKIKSKMALDDRVNARAINVDTTGSVVTLSGTVASRDVRDRAVRLARDTEGVTQVVDKLRVRSDRKAKSTRSLSGRARP
jgi:hyperosmotically inducible periplasmic protein